MPECEELIVKVLGDDGSGSGDGVRDGVLWAASAGANIISMSLGSSNPDERIRQALLEVVDAGVTVICAAGNEGPIAGIDTVGYPARWIQAISVGAVDDQGRPAPFSSRGPEIDICAPGVNVLSTYRNGGYAKLSGTSMATPFVSGVVGLLLSTGVKLSPASVKAMLRNSAKKWKPGENQDSGVGLIDPGVLLAPVADPVICPKLPDPSTIVPVGPFKISVEKIGDRSGLFISIS
jgi:subtilisin family serine protease